MQAVDHVHDFPLIYPINGVGVKMPHLGWQATKLKSRNLPLQPSNRKQVSCFRRRGDSSSPSKCDSPNVIRANVQPCSWHFGHCLVNCICSIILGALNGSESRHIAPVTCEDLNSNSLFTSESFHNGASLNGGRIIDYSALHLLIARSALGEN